MFRLTPSESRAAGFILAACCVGFAIHVGIAQEWHFFNWLKTPVIISHRVSKININRASARQLDSLPGIGPQLAQRIIEDRKIHGPYRSLEDLKHVKGINRKLREKIISNIIF